MITHIVLWKLANPAKKTEHTDEIKKRLESLVGQVPGLITAKVAQGFNGYDVVLISTHESKKALELYQEHPAHIAVKQYVHTVISERASCDFESE